MKKKIFLLIVLTLLVTIVFNVNQDVAYATEYQSGDFYYTLDGSSNVVITGYYGTETDVVIPSMLDGHSVIRIDNYAFENRSDLININIPNSVTEIGACAFKGCGGLININIPNSVTVIGSYAFSSCINLTSVNIPSSVTEIGTCAFMYCPRLIDVNLEDGLTILGDGMFRGCIDLENVNIPGSVTEIGRYVFLNCTGLTDVNLEDGLTILGQGMFINCTDLTSVGIPSSVTQIGNDAFNSCSELNTVRFYGNSPDTQGSDPFLNTSDIKFYYLAGAIGFNDLPWAERSVVFIPVTGVFIDSQEMAMTKWISKTLVSHVLPETADFEGVRWSSDNNSVATVNENGTVEGIAAGTATITAKTEDGGFTASCEVTVVTIDSILDYLDDAVGDLKLTSTDKDIQKVDDIKVYIADTREILESDIDIKVDVAIDLLNMILLESDKTLSKLRSDLVEVKTHIENGEIRKAMDKLEKVSKYQVFIIGEIEKVELFNQIELLIYDFSVH